MKVVLALVVLVSLLSFRFSEHSKTPPRRGIVERSFIGVTLTDTLLPDDSLPPDSLPQDSIPHDSCHVRDTVYRDCDGSFCFRLLNLCHDTCYCVYIQFSDGTSSIQNIYVPAYSFMKTCFEKQIEKLYYVPSVCPSCFGRKENANQSKKAPEQKFENIRLYPNPAKDKIFISGFSNSAESRIIIYDALGNIITKGSLSGNKVDISTLLHGSYYLQIINGITPVAIQKFIK